MSTDNNPRLGRPKSTNRCTKCAVCSRCSYDMDGTFWIHGNSVHIVRIPYYEKWSKLPDSWKEAKTLRHCNISERIRAEGQAFLYLITYWHWWNVVEISNRSWNHNPMSAEVQIPQDKKKFDEFNQRSSITKKSSWQIGCSTWNKCYSDFTQKFSRKMHKNRLQLLEAGQLMVACITEIL